MRLSLKNTNSTPDIIISARRVRRKKKLHNLLIVKNFPNKISIGARLINIISLTRDTVFDIKPILINRDPLKRGKQLISGLCLSLHVGFSGFLQ